jgi:hypothetical protein
LFRDRGWEVHAPGLRYHDGNPKADPDPALTDTSILDYTKDVATLSGALTHRRFSSGIPLARSLLRRLRPKASPAALR